MNLVKLMSPFIVVNWT